jgi:hypothetical protein
LSRAAKLVFHLDPQAIWNASDPSGKLVYSFKNGDVVDAELDLDGKPTDQYLRNALEAGIAFIGPVKQGSMPTQPDRFEEFLRKVDPLMQSPPLYRSLEFACVAVRRDGEWILVSGRAVLSTEACSHRALISPILCVKELLALSGRIRAETVNNLVANLRDSWVIKGLGAENVRLAAEIARSYDWSLPAVHSIDKSWNSSSRWGRAFALYGNGPDLSSHLSYSAWQEIDSQLRRSTPAFSGFDALCSKLELPAHRSNLRSSFYLSAELPARFVGIQTDPAGSTLDIDIECVGWPDLMIDWLPQHDFQRVPAGWEREATADHHHVSLAVPGGATKADLILSFAELDADTKTLEITRKKLNDAESARRSRPAYEHERWKGTGKTLGEGGQAQVSVVEDTRKEYPGQWALKRLRNVDDPKAKERFGQEVKAVQSINHPNILRIIHSDLASGRPYFVAEYCEGGSLQKNGASRYRGDIAATTQVLLPILDALVAAHKAGVFHRDVKPANILIRGDGTPVIGDFGICFMEGGQHVTLSNEGVGSRNFIAPEMESGQRHLGDPSDRTDVYSLGKVIYWMLSGGKEFAREDYPSLADLLNDQRFEHVHRLLSRMVVREPAKRVPGHELKKELEITSSLVEGNFSPLSPSIGIRCRFCGIGTYARYAKESARAIPSLGLSPAAPSGNVGVLRCQRCGHVELFQFSGIENPAWWEQ